MRWTRRPALHFVAIGIALYLGKHELLPAQTRPAVVITPGRVAQLRADFERATGRTPGEADERVLLDGAIEEEVLYLEARARGLAGHDSAIKFRLTEKMRFVTDAVQAEENAIDETLYRQAVALGFDEHDPIVRRIIVQKMRLFLAHQASAKVPGDDDLRRYYERHRMRYRREPRVTFWHVFVAHGRQPAGARLAAVALLERIRADAIRPADAVALGHPFLMGAHLAAQSAHDLGKLFGLEFADRVAAMEPGRWEGPVASSQGFHLVRVEARQPERIAPFESVWSRVRAEYQSEQQAAYLAETLAALRARYVVRIEPTVGTGQG